MDGRRFDALARSFAAESASRRTAFRALAGAAVGGLLTRLGEEDAAAACRPAGKKCKRGAQCCTRSCTRRGTCACKPAGKACGGPGECCTGLCEDGACACPSDRVRCGGKCCAANQQCTDGRCVTELGPAVACPACGSCEACDEGTGECGVACTDPCLAASLCRRANGNAAFRRLSGHLAAQGYRVEAAEPSALQLRGKRKASGVVIRHAGPNPGEAAALIFAVGQDGRTVPVAVLVRDDAPYAVAGIDKRGNVATEPVGGQAAAKTAAGAFDCYPVCGLGGCNDCESRCRIIRRSVWGVGSAVVAASVKRFGGDGGSAAGIAVAMNVYGNAGVDECRADCNKGICGPCAECNRANGKCKPTCDPGIACCENACIDTSDDPENCGACGHECADGELCIAGACCPPKRVCEAGGAEVCCPDGYACCAGECYPEDATPCGDTCCASWEVCLDAQASLCCFDGQVACGGGCCFGECCNGTCCEGGKVCDGGTCKCPSGRLACGDRCCHAAAVACGENGACLNACDLDPNGCGG